MNVYFLKMLEEKGRLIALYDPKMGHLGKFLDGGWGLPRPKIQMWIKCNLLYLLVSTRAVIGQFSGPYSPVRPAKI